RTGTCSGFGGPPAGSGVGGSFGGGTPSTAGRRPRTVSVTFGPAISGAGPGFPIPLPACGGFPPVVVGPRPVCSGCAFCVEGRPTPGVSGKGCSARPLVGGPAAGGAGEGGGAGGGVGDGVIWTAGAGSGRYCQTAHAAVAVTTAAVSNCTRRSWTALRNAMTFAATRC